MIGWLKTIGNWFDARTRLSRTLHADDAPSGAARAGWPAWAGGTCSAARRSRCFLIQILTGIGLALVYVPAADKAYESLLFLNYDQPLGWFLRALHYYSGSGMVVMLLVHMTQVFLHGRTNIRAS